MIESPLVPTPLTELSEEELLFKQSTAEFANSRLRPHVAEMDQAGHFRADLIEEFFRLGLMGIQIPERLGGAESSFFMSILAVEDLSQVDPSAGVIVDVQNTLVNNALIALGNSRAARQVLPVPGREMGRQLRPLRGHLG